ncbi:uncharacterized protein VTP21DRAFT_8633 [Calcarisporiella thermophila]|uniref:uncharacterized protein n=1 Tax=Calcarisporiella thermophila TaxID=911321 RepID=UPI0037423A53
MFSVENKLSDRIPPPTTTTDNSLATSSIQSDATEVIDVENENGLLREILGFEAFSSTSQDFISDSNREEHKKKRSRIRAKVQRHNSGEREIISEAVPECIVPVKIKKSVPNYFLSVRLDSPRIQENLSKFYNRVNESRPELSKLLIKPKQVHVTLFVMHLKGEEEIQRARECLFNSKDIIQEYYPSIRPSLYFYGIGTFGNGRVVYCSPRHDESLVQFTALSRSLYERFQRDGIISLDCRIAQKFTPHATLMKVRGNFSLSLKDGSVLKTKRVPEDVYDEFKEYEFGTQTFAAIELSSMLLPKEDDYYKCMARMEF